MKSFIVIFVCFVVSATALPLNIYEDADGQEFVVLPVHREKRQVKWGANQNGYGVGATGNLLNNDNHRLDGSASATKAWGSHGIKPDSFGGQLDYQHKPTGSGAFVGANRTPGWGTDVNAGAKYNFAQGKNWGADVSGQYGRHFGGPGGTGKPQAGAFLNVHGRF